MHAPPVEKKFFYLSGMPRSGSTLLAAILSQNPDIFVTPTSFAFDIIFGIQEKWNKTPEAKASGTEAQLLNIFSSILDTTWQHVPKKYVIDKHRAWPRNLRGLYAMGRGEQPKIICTARSVAEVVASFLILARKHPGNNRIDRILDEEGKPWTDENRCEVIWSRLGSDGWTSFKIGWEENRRCLHIVEYDDLLQDPDRVIAGIHTFLGIPQNFTYDYGNVRLQVQENDEAFGIPELHNIRPKLGRTSPPAIETLGDKLFLKYQDQKLEFWRRSSWW